MKQEDAKLLANRVVHFYKNVANEDIKSTCRHFMHEGYHRFTIKRIVNRYVESGSVEHKAKTGRIAKICSLQMIRRVGKFLQKEPNISNRAASARLGLEPSTYRFIKVTKLGIRARKKRVAPKYVDQQAERAKRACRFIYRKKLLSGDEKVLVIDDETYVQMDNQQVAGNQYYHARQPGDVSPAQRLRSCQKFPKKFLVWQCLDEAGHVSEPFICEGTMNWEIYLKECLQKRMLPFIQKYDLAGRVLFWPDMATCHYKREVVDWLRAQKIDFVEKNENAPNVPQARPIEKFWALCKGEYRRRSSGAKNLNSFKRIWKNIADKVAQKSAPALMKEARRNLKLIGYKGVYAPFD